MYKFSTQNQVISIILFYNIRLHITVHDQSKYAERVTLVSYIHWFLYDAKARGHSCAQSVG